MKRRVSKRAIAATRHCRRHQADQLISRMNMSVRVHCNTWQPGMCGAVMSWVDVNQQRVSPHLIGLLSKCWPKNHILLLNGFFGLWTMVLLIGAKLLCNAFRKLILVLFYFILQFMPVGSIK